MRESRNVISYLLYQGLSKLGDNFMFPETLRSTSLSEFV